MDFHHDVKKNLFRQLQSSINKAADINEDFANADFDEYLFAELMKQERYSLIAYNEAVRASHTILKIVADGVQ
ncbi:MULTISPECIES: hypothetical protein [Pseudomonas]|uniref:hypothetical protein n=1 Tax=Pseudomonas TaxID=286 RepID=UPI00249BFE04|nr:MULTISPECIES: hypothetical protein [Pseudomonas]MDI3204387.1 hypothetical protein [Pseudomonas shahriarae]WLH58245.1 hypothetical protein PSH73_04160 [Pseudomonas sp. FP2294]